MGSRIAMCLTVFLCTAAGKGLAETPRVAEQWREEGRAIAARFMAELRTELLAALGAGGPVNGVEVCRGRAREIADRHSRESGFRVGRTSSRVRNPTNAPDAWEEEALRGLEARAAVGDPPGGLEHSEVVDQGGKRVLRQLLAIPMGEPCLVCHGDNLEPEVQRAVHALYPEDRAVGFRVGEIRGAFTLSRILE